ncbi:hypothetical protein GOP47_0015556 [Adiantum capillus-veneris]|uniref:Histone deacetylase domain-containing protein n=1 Tax=Adiantum capillus-veneris TaxID=13818 RepID=A0A9D4UJZ1_ADICA|nr:hypothetical protein GOP47_0015556 [Adiantum capillus-veneris]
MEHCASLSCPMDPNIMLAKNDDISYISISSFLSFYFIWSIRVHTNFLHSLWQTALRVLGYSHGTIDHSAIMLEMIPLLAILILIGSGVNTLGDYIQELLDADAHGGRVFSTGTKLVQGSLNAALLAAGTTLEAMKSILEGRNRLAYALIRPPGHHAQPTQADGYCFLNNAGLAVQLAIASGIKRVAVVDIDVHYGNGTAEGFYDRDDVLTISLHMNHGSWGPSHPQTGLPNEVGKGKGAGFNLNIPLPNGCGDKGYEYAMQEMAIPVVAKFRPEIIVMVVGQDSSAFDPNGRQCLTMAGYCRLGQLVRDQAELYSDGRVLLVQEGGYHITYSAYCLHATIEGVLHLPTPTLSDPIAYYPEDENLAVVAVAQVKKEWITACLDVKL